ncbi:MAG: helix-turn-helix transcriptional regulator [Anaeroplasma sp.]|nr:helix-turn-helix transcriptional regulator [Anaeroplasma sp.]
MIIVNIDVMLAKKKMSVSDLTDCLGLTMANVSLLKNGKLKGIKFETLDKLCEIFDCQPADLLEYKPNKKTI